MTSVLSAGRAGYRRTLVHSGLGYLALALACLLLYRFNSSVALIWLPNVLGFVALARQERRRRPAMAAVFFVASLLTNTIADRAPLHALIASVVNVIEMLLAAALMDAFHSEHEDEPSVSFCLKVLLAYVFVARPVGSLLLSGALSALLGTLVFETLQRHWLSGAVAAMLILPLCLIYTRERLREMLRWPASAETVGVSLCIAVVSYYVFEQVHFPTIFIVIPLVLVALHRGAFRAAVVSNLVLLILCAAMLAGWVEVPPVIVQAGAKISWAAGAVVCACASLIGLAADQLRRHSRRLGESEARFRGALEFAATGFVLLKPNGVVNEANPYFCAMLGYRREELVGTSGGAITHPEDLDLSRRQLQMLADEELPQISFEKRYLHKNGSVVWGQVKASLLRKSTHGKKEIIAQVDDITERKINQERILALTERLALATRALGLGVWDYDLRRQHLLCDEQTYRLYGIDPRDAAPQFEVWREHIHPDDRGRAQTALFESIMGFRDFDIEYRVVWPDGEVRTLKAAAVVQRDEAGTPLHVVGVNWDITELKRNEAALLDVRTQLQSVIDAASEFAIIAADLNGVVVLFNTGAERMLGYAAGEVIGRMTLDRFHRSEEIVDLHRGGRALTRLKTDYLELLVEDVRKGKADAREWTYVRKDGSHLTVSLVMTAIHDTLGRITGFLGIARDVTQQHQAQLALALAKDQAEAASRAKSEFLANMSHEIRTPMNAVLGMAHLLGTTTLDAEQREYLDMINLSGRSLLRIINLSGRSLLRIINDILDFSKIEANHLELVDSEFMLCDVMDAIAGILSVNVAEKDLEMVIDVRPDVPAAFRGDALRLQQILINLASNAIKFTQQGEVCIAVESLGDHLGRCRLRFTVRDTGVGIDPGQLDRLFLPFAQGDGSVTRRFGGTGLGLAISKRLVELMGGRIGVTSRSGEGSEFWFTLELAPVQGARKRRRALWSKQLRLLAIEDNASAGRALDDAFAVLGWSAALCASTHEALERLSARAEPPFDAVLLDWTLPEQDAFERVRERMDERLPGCPLVVMVNPFQRDVALHHARAGAIDALLNKPVTVSSLVNALQDAFDARSGQSPRPVAAGGRAAARSGPFEGRRLLLVEDNTINQIVARGILEQTGAQIDVVGDGLLAVETLRERPDAYDVVLMDVQMPVMDGYTATRFIRGELGLKLPVLAVTAGAMESDRQMCLACGMNDIITKPLDVKQMIQTIGRYLSS